MLRLMSSIILLLTLRGEEHKEKTDAASFDPEVKQNCQVQQAPVIYKNKLMSLGNVKSTFARLT
jgi:hypothetical protein